MREQVIKHLSAQSLLAVNAPCVLPFQMGSGLSEVTDKGRVAHTAASVCLPDSHMADSGEKSFCTVKSHEHPL